MSRPSKDTAILQGAEAIERAAQAIPEQTQRALAARLGVSEQRLCLWKKRGVPVTECLGIEDRSGGVLCCHEVRPDKFDPPVEPADSERGAA